MVGEKRNEDASILKVMLNYLQMVWLHLAYYAIVCV
jgi:hypothetical protein